MAMDHLAHPVAVGVVSVVGCATATQIHHLQLVLRVPGHLGQMGHFGHVSVLVVGILLDALVWTFADRCARQTVAFGNGIRLG